MNGLPTQQVGIKTKFAFQEGQHQQNDGAEAPTQFYMGVSTLAPWASVDPQSVLDSLKETGVMCPAMGFAYDESTRTGRKLVVMLDFRRKVTWQEARALLANVTIGKLLPVRCVGGVPGTDQVAFQAIGSWLVHPDEATASAAPTNVAPVRKLPRKE